MVWTATPGSPSTFPPPACRRSPERIRLNSHEPVPRRLRTRIRGSSLILSKWRWMPTAWPTAMAMDFRVGGKMTIISATAILPMPSWMRMATHSPRCWNTTAGSCPATPTVATPMATGCLMRQSWLRGATPTSLTLTATDFRIRTKLQKHLFLHRS